MEIILLILAIICCSICALCGCMVVLMMFAIWHDRPKNKTLTKEEWQMGIREK